jgi:steroid delta-isomerase-like uncharacterized protein
VKPSDVHRAAHDAFNRRDWARIREMLSDDYVYVDRAEGREVGSPDEFLSWLQEWTGWMSDAKVSDGTYLDADGHSIALFTVSGTNDGPIGAVKPSQRPLRMPFCELRRIDEEGLIELGEINYDRLTLRRQLGLA